MKRLLDIDLGLIRIFLQVVESNGFSAAQAALGMNASTISAKMSKLENQLGYRLCRRGRSGFRLTPQGQVAYEAGRRLLRSVEDFCSEATALKGRLAGEVRLGVLDNILRDPNAPLELALREFLAMPNEVHVTSVTGNPVDLAQKVLQGTLHLALTSAPQKLPGLNYEAIHEEENGLYCGRGHPLFGWAPPGPTLEEIRKHALIGRAHWIRRGPRLLPGTTPRATVSDVERELELILTGRFLGLLPLAFAAPWVASGDLERVAPEQIKWRVPFYVLTKRGYAMPPSATALIELIREHF